jgi:hypothetical protein
MRVLERWGAGDRYWADRRACVVWTCGLPTYRSTPRSTVARVHKVRCTVHAMSRVAGTKRRPRTVSPPVPPLTR